MYQMIIMNLMGMNLTEDIGITKTNLVRMFENEVTPALQSGELTADNNDMLMEKIKGIYDEHTKIPKKELRKLLSHDLWWDAKKCLRYGMIDSIITPQ